LFEFAPIANEYLRTHLFGDIFERDNLDWQKASELAAVGMLSALPGAEPQLQVLFAGLRAASFTEGRRP
jgi:alkylhydroperoxidase/carboxymuconolactone decarboxylase family protein YurZ